MKEIPMNWKIKLTLPEEWRSSKYIISKFEGYLYNLKSGTNILIFQRLYKPLVKIKTVESGLKYFHENRS